MSPIYYQPVPLLSIVLFILLPFFPLPFLVFWFVFPLTLAPYIPWKTPQLIIRYFIWQLANYSMSVNKIQVIWRSGEKAGIRQDRTETEKPPPLRWCSLNTDTFGLTSAYGDWALWCVRWATKALLSLESKDYVTGDEQDSQTPQLSSLPNP